MRLPIKFISFDDGYFNSNNKIGHVEILNIGAGKTLPIDLRRFPKYFLVNIDPIYFTDTTLPIEEVERRHFNSYKETYENIRCYNEIDDVLERYYGTFHIITMYRYLEHVAFDNVLYFIYKLSTIIDVGGYIDIIVPDAKKLARYILEEKPGKAGFDSNNIIVTTELLNCPSDPHASLWTVDRIRHFFTLEKRFELVRTYNPYTFDGRNIYVRAIVKRVK